MRSALTRPEALQARLQRFLPTGQAFDIVGCNLYAVHQRVAQKFRAGRAILAGDAAHVNSPIGAMGMNSGIHDAFNLADKLIKICAGKPSTTCSTATSASAATSPCSTRRRRPSATSACWRKRTPPCAARTTTNCAAPPKIPKLARAFLLRSSLIESLREAEQIG